MSYSFIGARTLVQAPKSYSFIYYNLYLVKIHSFCFFLYSHMIPYIEVKVLTLTKKIN